jgi:hypothetical protein
MRRTHYITTSGTSTPSFPMATALKTSNVLFE